MSGKNKEEYQVVSGIKIGHKKLPKYLLVVYLVLGLWAIGYALFAPGKLVVSGAQEITADKGEKIVTGTCFSCHDTGAAPLLKGVTDRLTEDEIKHILKNGRNTMPALASRYSEAEIEAIIAFLKTYE